MKRRGTRLCFWLIACSAWLLCACGNSAAPDGVTAPVSSSASSPAESTPALELSFGVYTSDKPSTMYKKFKPLLEEVEQRMQKSMGRSVDVKLRIFKTYDLAREALVSGEVGFARFGPASYVLARQKNPKIALLAIEQRKGKLKFYGTIVVPETSPIKTVADLKGRSFAFGDKSSTIGRYLAQLEMMQAGLQLSDLSRHEYLGRHDKVVAAVALGTFDAGAAKESTVKKHMGKPLRVLKRFDNVTKPWVASSVLEPAVNEALRGALLAITDKKLLKPLSKSATGFSPPDDKLYDVIRDAIRESAKFETSH
ncbi:MAG: PhnD/SsuA/transferrin family substrate-binding protein [Polyangiaceae bacterium]